MRKMLSALFPENLSGACLVRDNGFIHIGLSVNTQLPIAGYPGGFLIHPVGITDDGEQNIIVIDDFFGLLGSLVRLNDSAGCRVEHGDRRAESERHIHAIIHRHQQSRQVGRAGAKIVQMRYP